MGCPKQWFLARQIVNSSEVNMSSRISCSEQQLYFEHRSFDITMLYSSNTRPYSYLQKKITNHIWNTNFQSPGEDPSSSSARFTYSCEKFCSTKLEIVTMENPSTSKGQNASDTVPEKPVVPSEPAGKKQSRKRFFQGLVNPPEKTYYKRHLSLFTPIYNRNRWTVLSKST